MTPKDNLVKVRSPFSLSSPLTAFMALVSVPYLVASWAFSRRLATIEPASVRQSLYLTLVAMTTLGVAALCNLVSLATGSVLPPGTASFVAIYALAVFSGFFVHGRSHMAFLAACWDGSESVRASETSQADC